MNETTVNFQAKFNKRQEAVVSAFSKIGYTVLWSPNGVPMINRDKKEIYLPMLRDDELSNVTNIVRGWVDHEMAHEIFDSKNEILKDAIGKGKAFETIFRMVEDGRIERMLSEMLIGCKENLENLEDVLIRDGKAVSVGVSLFLLCKYGEKGVEKFGMSDFIKSLSEETKLNTFKADSCKKAFDISQKIYDELKIDEMKAAMEKLKQEMIKKIKSGEIKKKDLKKSSKRFDDFTTIEITEEDLKDSPEEKKEKEDKKKEKDKEEREPSKKKKSKEEIDKSEEEEMEDSESDDDDDSEESDSESDGSETEEKSKKEPKEKEKKKKSEKSKDKDSKDDDEEADDSSDEMGDLSESDECDDEMSDDLDDSDSESAEEGSEGSVSVPADKEKMERDVKRILDSKLSEKDLSEKIREKIESEMKESASKGKRTETYIPFTKYDKVIEVYKEKRYGSTRFGASNILRDVYSDVNVLSQKLRLELLSSKMLKTRYKEKGMLDNRRLHILGMKTGQSNVFSSRIRKESLNTAVSLLIDSSGSMSSDSKSLLAVRIGYLLASTMEILGIPNEILSFTQSGGFDGGCDEVIDGYSRYYPLLHYVHKPFDMKIRHCMNGLSHFGDVMCENSDGESVLWAASRLIERREKRKILFVISDGVPANSESNAYMLRDHLKSVVKMVSKCGIECVGIGVLTDSVSSFYKNYVVIHNIADVARAAYGKITESIRGAVMDAAR